MKSRGIRLYFLYVWRFMREKWLSFLLLGVLLFISGFVYTAIADSVGAFQAASEDYFEKTNQEDFVFEVSDTLDLTERERVFEECGITATSMSSLYREDRDCYMDIVHQRQDRLLAEFADIDLEARLAKDLTFAVEGDNYRMRILNDAETINKSHIEKGEAPGEGEIAITQNFARARGLSIGDTLELRDATYAISGFVLFPDYNLPIIDHVLLMDSTHQTLALLNDADFADFNVAPSMYFSGVLSATDGDSLEAAIDEGTYLELPFFERLILTENNVRSGAIYAEIEGSQAFALIFSLFIAALGLIIILMLLAKTIRASKRPFGVLKALGVPNRALIGPFLAVFGLYGLAFLLAGYTVGHIVAPPLQDLYRMFYLLPAGDVVFRPETFFVAILAPMVLLLSVTYWLLKRMFRLRPVDLIHPKLSDFAVVKFKRMRNAFARFSFLFRLQVAFIARHMGKFAVYVLGIVAAVYAGLLSFSMMGVLERTLPDYYENTSIVSKGYCEGLCTDEDEYGERVLEAPMQINGERAEIIGLSDGQSLHPLEDAAGNDLLGKLEEGLVISASFRDLTGFSRGDTVTLRVAGRELEKEIVDVATPYAGSQVFMDRSALGEWLFDDETAYNAVYADERLSEEAFASVVHVEDLLEHVASLHDVFNAFIFTIIGAALAVGLIVVYLLTVMTVEDHYYPLALFKVLGYDNKDIHRILLGGYEKANVVFFLLTIPIAVASFSFFRRWIAEMYEFLVPLQVLPLHVGIFAALFLLMTLLGTLSAKRRIKRLSLQEALAIYQE